MLVEKAEKAKYNDLNVLHLGAVAGFTSPFTAQLQRLLVVKLRT